MHSTRRCDGLGSRVASPLVVIGVLFRRQELSKKSALERNVEKLIESAQNNVCIALDPLAFFPKLSVNKKESPDTVNWFHYEGSLTSFLRSLIDLSFDRAPAGRALGSRLTAKSNLGLLV